VAPGRRRPAPRGPPRGGGLRRGLAARRTARPGRAGAVRRRTPHRPVGSRPRRAHGRRVVRRRRRAVRLLARAAGGGTGARARALRVVRRRGAERRVRPADRPPVADVRAAHHRRRLADPHLLGGLHGPRPGAAEVLRPAQHVRRGDAHPRPGQRIRDAVPRLGGRRPRVVPAHRLLHGTPVGGQRRQEGVPHEPRRRRRAGAGDLPAVRRARDHAVRRGVRPRRGDLAGHADRDHPAPAARCVRQVGPVPAAGLAPRRHGGPDAGLGAHPRGDDGHRRRLPHRPVQPALRPRAGRAARRHDHRGDHAADRRDHRLRLRRHQEGAGLLHGEPDRLHDAGRRARARRLRRGAGPPAHPRLLQGRALPRCRLGDARDGRRDRHAPLRRAVAPHAGDVRDVHARLPGADRLPVPLGLLHEGPDHRGLADRGPGGRVDPRRCGAARGRAHRVLHDAPDAHDVLRAGALARPAPAADRRRGPRGPAGALPPARVGGLDDRADDPAGPRVGGRRRVPRRRGAPGPLPGGVDRPRGRAVRRPGRVLRRPGPLPRHRADARRRRRRLPGRGPPVGAGGAPAAGEPAGAGRARRPLRQRDQREGHRPAGHLALARAGLPRQPRRRRGRQRHRRPARRHVRPAAAHADRLRPLLRPDHPGRLRRARRGPAHRRRVRRM
ncbi:MAG: NADH-ubiquinone oxidoreductase chain L, partial [uncultured Actinomycetospora sp.]